MRESKRRKKKVKRKEIICVCVVCEKYCVRAFDDECDQERAKGRCQDPIKHNML